MDVLLIVWGLCVIAALWFLAMGTVRLLAWRSGAADHTQGMHNVARFNLIVGFVAAGLVGILSVMLFLRG